MSWRIIEREFFVGAFATFILKGYEPRDVMETASGYGVTFAEIREAVIASTPPGVWRLQLLQSLDSTARAMIE